MNSRRDKRISWLVGCVLLCALFALCWSGCGKRKAKPAVELPIYFTCDTQGRLEPCGCFTGQFGGLTRLRTVLTAAAANSIQVDVGDAIGGREDYDLIQYRYMLRAFAAMHYDALNAGHREARLSVGQLRELKKNSPVPLLSANLTDEATGQPVLESYRIVERSGVRVALIGVLDPHNAGEPGEGVVIGSMESAISRALAELRGRADVIVLLAFADEDALAAIARQFYEIPVILGGKVRQPAQELRRENRSWIYFVTNEARALALLKLRFSETEPLDVTENRIALLHDRIPQDAEFVRLAQEYRGEIRRTPLAVDDPTHLAADQVPGIRAAADFVGTEACVRCHGSAAAVWSGSGHARAFAPLQSREADADPKCVGCHTIGFGSPSGYQRSYGAARLVNVGCESCHGPGSLHIRKMEGDRSLDFVFRPLDEGDCRKCHYGEFSRPFHWDEFWSPIQHGKERRTVSAKTP